MVEIVEPINVSDVEIYRDGGTIEFRVFGSRADGFYRLQTPLLGTPQPLFKDGHKLEFGSPDELAILTALREWQTIVATSDVIQSLGELDNLKVWQNLPQNLSDVVPIHHIRSVVRRLSERWS